MSVGLLGNFRHFLQAKTADIMLFNDKYKQTYFFS